MPALGSGDTFRFLFSGTSVVLVTVIVWVETRPRIELKSAFQIWGTPKLAEF